MPGVSSAKLPFRAAQGRAGHRRVAAWWDDVLMQTCPCKRAPTLRTRILLVSDLQSKISIVTQEKRVSSVRENNLELNKGLFYCWSMDLT
jgi:hypothetical protein